MAIKFNETKLRNNRENIEKYFDSIVLNEL